MSKKKVILKAPVAPPRLHPIKILFDKRDLDSDSLFKINAQITTNIGTFDFVIQSSATGQSLLNDITKAIGVDEFWWFGILYR